MSEARLMREVQVLASKLGARLFRNNVAQSWVGKLYKPTKQTQVNVGPNDVVLYNARPLHAGLCEGSSDLIGWRSVTITEEMIGCKFAIFAAVEIKTSSGKATQAQLAFVDAVKRAGGMGLVVRSIEEATKGLSGE